MLVVLFNHDLCELDFYDLFSTLTQWYFSTSSKFIYNWEVYFNFWILIRDLVDIIEPNIYAVIFLVKLFRGMLCRDDEKHLNFGVLLCWTNDSI